MTQNQSLTMLFPAHAIQALRWQPLSISGGADSVRGDFPKLAPAQAKIKEALDKQQWLLKENQHLFVPPTHLDDYQGHIFSMGDFVKRADEAREADVLRTAVDKNGQRRKLSPEQLLQIKQTGELDVPSELFEDQYHTWRIKSAFYSGTSTVKRSFGAGLGKVLDHYVVYMGDAVTSKKDDKRPTLRKSLLHGLGRALEILREAIGQLFAGRLRHRTYSDFQIQEILLDAEFGYVLYHLRDHDTRGLFSDTSYNERGYHRESNWEVLQNDTDFDTKYRVSIEQLKEAQAARTHIGKLQRIFETKMRSARNKQLNLDKEKMLASPLAAITEAKRADHEWSEAKDQAWIDHLYSQTEEESKLVGRLEADRLLAQQTEATVKREDSEQVEEHLKKFEESLKKERPVLSLSRVWNERKVEVERHRMEAILVSTRPARIAQLLEEQDLEVECAARRLAEKFRRDHREDLDKQLRQKMSAFPPAEFQVLQLNPNNWESWGERHKTVQVDLGKPLWRMRYTWMMFVTSAKFMIGSAFHFLTSGPFSFRAFFSPKEFYAVERPSRAESTLTQTLASRLRSFHATLRQVRDQFDSEPDTGLIAKSIQSFFLQVYLALKGTIGSVWIAAFMTVGTIVASALNLVMLTLAPVLATVFTFVSTLFNLIIYDTAVANARNRASHGDYKMPSSVSPFLKIGLVMPFMLIFPGALQSITATLRIVVLHPAIGTLVLCWTTLCFTLRNLRDSCTWFLIRKYSRIPASDTYLAKRIHGPGLAPIEYYRLPVEAAKTSVLFSLDNYRLHAHSNVRRCELDAPYQGYSNIFRQLVKPFRVHTSMVVQSPSSIAFRLAWLVRSDEEEYPQYRPTSIPPGHVFDIWDAVARGVRSAHPDFGPAQAASKMRRWEASVSQSSSLSKMDERDMAALESSYNDELSSGETELDEMVNRAAKVLAEWNLKVDLRQVRLLQAVAIPPSAAGRFRMSEAEQQDLWKFTLEAVETYGQQIKGELEEILATSAFSNEIRASVKRAIDSFYTDSGARPGQDIALIASFLLRRLLGGGDEMLQTLEQTDDRLVLSPKISEEDEHLLFWKSFAIM